MARRRTESGDRKLLRLVRSSDTATGRGDPQAEKILATFSERAAENGLRAVVMAELARDLGMSTKTLYKHYPTKAELVRTLLARWARELGHRRAQRSRDEGSLVDRLAVGAQDWIEFTSQYGGLFWAELEREYPEAHALYTRELGLLLQRASRELRGRLRRDAHPVLAMSLLIAAIRQASDDDLCRRLGLGRREAVRRAVDQWARGAVAR